MDRTVILTMIFCATFIAIVAIICDFLKKKESESSLENSLTQKIIKLHRNYIISFLGLAIIMLISAKYGGPDNNIYDYLSFGSTITSLVLSILAIFITVQSSSDLYKQFMRIDNATDTITNVSKQLDGTFARLSDTEQKLIITSNQISNQIESIIYRVDEKLKERMEATEHKLAEQINSLNSQNTSKEHDNSEILNATKDYYLNSISAIGGLVIYACILSLKNKKDFILSDLLKDNEAYAYGFLISTISVGFITATIDENYKVTCTNSLYSENELIKKLKEFVERFGQDYLNKINTINKFFGEKELVFELKPED